MEALQTLNAALKARGVKARVLIVKDRLFLRGTFITSDGAKKEKKIPLGLPANQSQLLEAENRVIALASIVNSTGILPSTMPWEAEKIELQAATKRKGLTVSESVSELEADFWKGKVRTSAAERTWERLKAETDRLPQAATITMDLLVATASKTKAGSRTRLESCKVLKRLGKLVGLQDLDRLDELRTPYEPSVREVPSAEDVADFLVTIDPDSTWWWPTWALATFGCRPAETFSLVPNGDGTARVLTVKRKGKDPTWRTALALPVAVKKEELVDDLRGGDWIPLDLPGERSVPWDVKSPTEYDSATAKRHCDCWSGWLRRQHPTLQLYDLRHAWAIRSISKLPSTSLAAKCMGHSIKTHHDSYHRWIDQADIAAVAATLN